jgi:hypothetical protein
MQRRWNVLSLSVALWIGLAVLGSHPAEAQYKNYTFGFEVGYLGQTAGTLLKPHNLALGMFGGFKFSDHWWFESRALVSFPGQLDNAPNTVVELSITPVSVRYYLETDAVRPWVGVTNTLQLLFNNTFDHTAYWGPGVGAGIEIRLRRDLYLGFEGDFFHLFIFQGEAGDAWLGTVTSQLIFFL